MSMPRELTERQREIMRFLCSKAMQSDRIPARAKLAEELGIAEHCLGVHLGLMEKKRAISTEFRKWNSIRINWDHPDALMG